MDPPPKVKKLPCKYCNRFFGRLEHLQRHERTHTKEAPYKCPCGKGFGRRDLLRRHEKSAHRGELAQILAHGKQTESNDPSADANSPDKQPRAVLEVEKTSPRRPQPSSRLSSSFPDLNSGTNFPDFNLTPNIAGTGLESQISPFHPTVPPTQNGTDSIWTENHVDMVHPDIGVQQAPLYESFSMLPAFDTTSLEFYNNNNYYDVFLDDVDFSTYFHAPGFGGQSTLPTMQPSGHTQIDFGTHEQTQNRGQQKQSSGPTEEPDGSFSRFGSPLPALPPEAHGGERGGQTYGHSKNIQQAGWKITAQNFDEIVTRIKGFDDVLPKDFQPLTRHTMARFMEGCINGLLGHLPLIHISTFSIRAAAPELVLSMLAIGAQFRFESRRATVLFYAAKAVLLEQIRRRQDEVVSEPLVRRQSFFTSSTSPVASAASDSPRNQNHVRPSRPSVNHRSMTETSKPSPHDQLQTLQALLILLVMGAWGSKQLVKEAMLLQGPAATLTREFQMTKVDPPAPCQSLSEKWHEWIRTESRRRTILKIYCFLQLMAVAYYHPPLLFTSEIDCLLPSLAKEWDAKTFQEWTDVRQLSGQGDVTFHEALESLFGTVSNLPAKTTFSAFTNYALLCALLQRIFLVRQAYSGSRGGFGPGSLKAADVEELTGALQAWQARWERSPESSIDPKCPFGPMSFNSTALLRVAWIRLFSETGPYRNLASRDPEMIATAFKNTPYLSRSPKLTFAIMHATHALSLPVRMGIGYVAKTQTMSWSVQHSLSNLECAIFLSKWLEVIAQTSAQTPLTREEKTLITMIKVMLQETGFFENEVINDIADLQGQTRKIQQLATAVARLWAEIYENSHVFDVVNAIGASLNIYAQLMDETHTPQETR